MNNKGHTMHLIQLQGSWDQPSAQGFTKYRSAIPSPAAGVSAGEVVVVAKGAVAAVAAIAVRDGPRTSIPCNRQPPEDGCDGQTENVHNLIPQKDLVYELRASPWQFDHHDSGKHSRLKDCDLCSNVL